MTSTLLVITPFFRSLSFRKAWVNAIEEVKKRLEDDEDGMETDEIDDPENPFRKQGETQTKGKRKVVSF